MAVVGYLLLERVGHYLFGWPNEFVEFF